MASFLNNPALMECQCAKTAPSKTSSAADQAEFYFFYCRNASFCLIGRMIRPHKRKRVYVVHLLPVQRFCRGILYDIERAVVCFKQPCSAEGICIFVLNRKTFGIRLFLVFYVFKRRQFDCIVDVFPFSCFINRSVNKRDIPDCNPAF